MSIFQKGRGWLTGFAILTISAISIFVGCNRSAPEEKRYPLQGEVISVDSAKKLLTVKHGEIPGAMSAMTMTYQVRSANEIKSLSPGDEIKAELVVSENHGGLEKIVLIEKASSGTALPTNKPGS